MQIAFTACSLLNSAVVDVASGETLYIITTPYKLGKRKTTIRDARGKTVARYKPRRWSHDQVEISGVTRSVSSWLASNGLFTSSKQFVAPNGKTYVWKRQWSKNKFKLVDRQTKRVIARSRYTRASLWTPKRITIDIDGEAVSILDAVLLSFIICEKKRRDEATVAATSGAASV